MTTEQNHETQWMTVMQAAKELDVSSQTVYRWIHQTRLKASRRGEGKASLLLLHPDDVRDARDRREAISPVHPQVDSR